MSDDELVKAIVDIGRKPNVYRRAVASGTLHLRPETMIAIQNGEIPKGSVTEASTVAAIQAVKDTPRLIPHCHSIPIDACNVAWNWIEGSLCCEVEVKANYRTGVEMEALCGVSAALLCAFDMVKSFEKDEQGQYPVARIENIHIVVKEKAEPASG